LDADGNPVPLSGLRVTAEDAGKVRVLADTAGAEGDLVATLRLTAVKAGKTRVTVAASGVEDQLPVDLRLPGSDAWGVAIRPGLIGFTYDYNARPDVSGRSGWGVQFEASRRINDYIGIAANLTAGSVGARLEDPATGGTGTQSTSLLEAHAALDFTPFRSPRVWPVVSAGFGRFHILSDEAGLGLKHTGNYWVVGGGLDVAISHNVTWQFRVATHQLIDPGITGQAKKIGSLLPVTTGIRFNF
jgi:hypothetical protein